tara:strand:- start:107 stop:370 length:264 start_codon:yes stop_codon:yes gene_type:complete
MKIKGLPKKILKELVSKPKSRTELDKLFGNSTKLALSTLSARHLINQVIQESGQRVVEITPLGRLQIDPDYCDSCECTPCDCGYGNY